ncbi:hypothetical protein D9M73_109600 [compost metagenome]
MCAAMAARRSLLVLVIRSISPAPSRGSISSRTMPIRSSIGAAPPGSVRTRAPPRRPILRVRATLLSAPARPRPASSRRSTRSSHSCNRSRRPTKLAWRATAPAIRSARHRRSSATAPQTRPMSDRISAPATVRSMSPHRATSTSAAEPRRIARRTAPRRRPPTMSTVPPGLPIFRRRRFTPPASVSRRPPSAHGLSVAGSLRLPPTVRISRRLRSRSPSFHRPRR